MHACDSRVSSVETGAGEGLVWSRVRQELGCVPAGVLSG